MRSSIGYAVLLLLSLIPVAKAAKTETQYLSGLGKDDPVQWQFKCDNGQNADKWSTIGVPSNWELQGFGIYTYGRVPPLDGWPEFTASTSASSPCLRRGKIKPSS